MVLRVDVVDAALEAAYGDQLAGRRIVLLAPSGRTFDEELARELAAEPDLTLLCGRYEGIDERVREHLVTDTVSIGPLRPLRRRAAGDGRRRRGAAQAARRSSARPRAPSRSRSARRSEERPSTRTTRARRYRGWDVPEVLRLRRPRARAGVAPRAQPRARRRLRAATIRGPARRTVLTPRGVSARFRPPLARARTSTRSRP